jgi:hypothetical protein
VRANAEYSLGAGAPDLPVGGSSLVASIRRWITAAYPANGDTRGRVFP